MLNVISNLNFFNLGDLVSFITSRWLYEKILTISFRQGSGRGTRIAEAVLPFLALAIPTILNRPCNILQYLFT